MKCIRNYLILGLAIVLLVPCLFVACSKEDKSDLPKIQTIVDPHPSDPKAPIESKMDYDLVSVTLSKTVYSLTEDAEIIANIVIDMDEENANLTFFRYPNIEKQENGAWVRYENAAYLKYAETENHYDMLIGAPGVFDMLSGGWIRYYRNSASVDVTITDIAPQMTPGHYRMIVYLANNYTHYLEFDLVE